MSPSRAAVARQAEANPLAAPLPGLIGAVRKAGQEDGKLVAGEWLMPLVGRALDRVMSRKEAAILLNLSEPELSKQVSGAEGKSLNVRKLGALGDRFAIALADEIREHFGLNDPANVVQQAMELVTRGMSMLVSEVKR
jgi:hypothetical protein